MVRTSSSSLVRRRGRDARYHPPDEKMRGVNTNVEHQGYQRIDGRIDYKGKTFEIRLHKKHRHQYSEFSSSPAPDPFFR